MPPQVKKVLQILEHAYPNAQCALDHKNPLQLLVATVLAAQCTDVRVNKVTPALFKKYRSAADYGNADLKTLEQEIKTTGFYSAKAKSLKGLGQKLTSDFGGQVPKTMDELLTLPGVGRKTANVVLGVCFDTPGIIVDTHFRRVSFRLGWTKNTDPEKIEQDAMKLIPHKDWTHASHLLTFHGRNICVALKPRCSACPVNPLCPKQGVTRHA